MGCFYKAPSRFLLVVLVLGLSVLGNSQSLSAPLPIPLTAKAWVSLSFNKIPSNQVSFKESSMRVQVNQSAGPLVHKLSRPQVISAFQVKGTWSGQKSTESGDFDEDSVLRVGLVAIGTQTLKGPKRWFAADWVKKLFDLAPEDLGLDRIYFFNLTNRNSQLGKSRIHPATDLIHERVVQVSQVEGKINFVHNLANPIDTAAIWISVDGDDTRSAFEITIDQLELFSKLKH